MNGNPTEKRIVVGVTGASGAEYARRLVECLCRAGVEVHLVVTANGRRLFIDELGIRELSAAVFGVANPALLIQHNYRDVGSTLGSGSFHTDGMIVCPCSGNTLAAIASGLAENLLTRAAAVTLKERRPLIVVPREMPMSRIELQNALRISEAGGVICPACPGFYMRPRVVADLVDFVVGKLLDLVMVPHDLNTRWADQLMQSDSVAKGAAD